MLSPIFAAVMASQGMHGWQESAARAMEDDAVVMVRRGYRVVTSDAYGWLRFGVVYYKVTYELTTSPAVDA